MAGALVHQVRVAVDAGQPRRAVAAEGLDQVLAGAAVPAGAAGALVPVQLALCAGEAGRAGAGEAVHAVLAVP